MAGPLPVCVLAAVTFAWLTVVDPQPRLRQFINSAVMAGFTWLAAMELFRERRGGLRLSAILNGCFALGMGGWFGFRAIRAMAFGYVELFEAGGFQLINMAMSSGYALACLFGTILMVNQRQVVAIRESNQELLLAKDEALLLEKKLLAERSHRQRQGLLRDLHDGLAGITAHIALAASSPAAVGTDGPMGERIRQLRELANSGHRELRLLMDMLQRGDTSWQESLSELRVHALNVLGAREIEVGWSVSGVMTSETVQDTSAMFSLMRVVKEAVNNAAKHSQARRVQIQFRFRPGVVGIRVQDDGVGMATGQPSAKGRGIKHMRDRVRELGGRQQIRGHGGTCVRIVVPLPLDIRPMASEGNLAGMGKGGGGVI